MLAPALFELKNRHGHAPVKIPAQIAQDVVGESALHRARLAYKPPLPPVLQQMNKIILTPSESKEEEMDQALAHTLKTLFPYIHGQKLVKFESGPENANPRKIRVGVVLSGGQAPGGHNVISGLFDALKAMNSENELIGFRDGPAGLVKNEYIRIGVEHVARYRNTGGFDMVGSGRTKIETEKQLQATRNTLEFHDMDGLVVVGGDDSNTNAAIIAEYLQSVDCKTVVCGVPKTIDGDLCNEHVEVSFGYDTACKTYSQEIGDIAKDARSAAKYWFFIKMMGRSASHVTLECALSTRPNIALIGEEVAEKKQSLADIVSYMADIVAQRAEMGKHYGVALIPEGLIEFIPEFKTLIASLNRLLANELHTLVLKALKRPDSKIEYVSSLLTGHTAEVFASLPLDFQQQLILDRDSHGNVTVSQIETEKLMGMMVAAELQKRKKQNKFKGEFNAVYHFCGYQGRSGFPSNFDAKYCYALGHVAAAIVNAGLTGYLCAISNLAQPEYRWVPKAVPITTLLNIEERHGKPKPVIKKALVDLNGPKYLLYFRERSRWAHQDAFVYPGPIQFYGPEEITEATNFHIRSLL